MHDQDEDDLKANSAGHYTEFDCPNCTANNPMPDGFGPGDEVRCNYCGDEFDVKQRNDGRLKLKPR